MKTVLLYIRSVPLDSAVKFRRGAGARRMTMAQYLSALVELHEAMRDLDEGTVKAELERLGLGTVEA